MILSYILGPLVILLPRVEVETSSFFPMKYSQGMLKSIASDNLVLLLAFSCGLSLSPAGLFLLTRGGSSGE